MRVLASADEIGGIKEAVFNRGTDTSKKAATQPISVKKKTVEDGFNSKTKVLYMQTFQDELLISARANGVVSINDIIEESDDAEAQYKLLHTYKLNVDADDKPVSLVTLEEHDTILVAFQSRKLFSIYLNDKKFDTAPIELELSGKRPIDAFVANPYKEGIYAYGGRAQDLQIVQLFEKQKLEKQEAFQELSFFKNEVIFTAENVENDYLDLKVPIWISKILFFKDQPEEGYKLITATRHGQIRLYDTSKSASPIGDYKVCDKPLVSLNFATEAQDEVIVSDTHTYVAKLSLSKIDPKGFKISSASAGVMYRPTTKLLGKFSEGGNTGAVFGVHVDLEENIVAFGGLDRYLRVFDIKSREILAKVYLGTQISDVVILDTEEEETEQDAEGEREVQVLSRKRRLLPKSDEEDEESDEEEVWKQLEDNSTTQAKPSKKSKKN